MHRSYPSRAAWLPDVLLLLSLALLTLSGLLISGCSKTATSTTAGDAPRAGKSAAINDAQPTMAARPTLTEPPAPQREFRGMFVTTAYNIDWPQKPSMPPSKMRAEMDMIISRAKQLNVNVIMLQVRSHGDRHHRKTNLTPPWARGLNKGNDPDPNPNANQRTYDPLAEWIRACHCNGIELHAWINPFRLSAKHPTLPSYRAHDKSWYLHWRDVSAQDHVLDVIEELLAYRVPPCTMRGEAPDPKMSIEPKMFSTSTAAMALAAEPEGLDGIIIDHYYPPPPPPVDEPGTKPATTPTTGPHSSADRENMTEPAPGALADAASTVGTAPMLLLTAAPGPSATTQRASRNAQGEGPVGAKANAGAAAAAAALRQRFCTSPDPAENFLCEVMHLVKTKPGAKLGFSPKHDDVDAQTWLGKGLLHYVVPELYFDDPQHWSKKLEPWLDANTLADPAREKPIVVAGLFTMRTHKPPPKQPPWPTPPWNATVILRQIDESRTAHGTTPLTKNNVASGQAHYSTNSLQPHPVGPAPGNNVGDLISSGTQPGQGQYREPRLVPMCVDTGAAPAKPDVTWNSVTGGRWQMPSDPLLNSGVLFWAVWLHDPAGWRPMQVVERNRMSVIDPTANGIAVKAIDVLNHESPFAVAP